jgi:hypothetical protein
MQMIRHYNEFMKRVRTPSSVTHQAIDEYLHVFPNLKDGMILPSLRCDEVRTAWRGSMC